MTKDTTPEIDVLIIGGGPAGLGAALSLGRLRRRVLVVDDGRPRNAPSSHAYNLPGHDGIHPAAWREAVRKDLRRYDTVGFVQDRVATLSQNEGRFRATMASGKTLTSRKVVLAYGMVDALPNIPGIREAWGKSVLHCPFCHGYEVRDQPLGMIGNAAVFFHAAPVISGLASDLILFTNGQALTPEQRAGLAGFKLVEERLRSIDQSEGQVSGVVLESGKAIPRHALFYAPTFPLALKSDLGDTLGCGRNDFGHYVVDERGQTTVPGVYAAGDIVAFASVILSAAAGSTAGASICFELAHEDHHQKISGTH